MILEKKNRKGAKTGKSGHYRAPTPQHREPTPRRTPMIGVNHACILVEFSVFFMAYMHDSQTFSVVLR